MEFLSEFIITSVIGTSFFLLVLLGYLASKSIESRKEKKAKFLWVARAEFLIDFEDLLTPLTELSRKETQDCPKCGGNLYWSFAKGLVACQRCNASYKIKDSYRS